MISLLGNPAFRNLWLASQLSIFGTQVSRMGLILYTFNVTDSVLNLALLVVLETLPGALAAPLAGVVIDGNSKRAVMIVSDLVRMAFMSVIALWPTLPVIYLMASLHSIATIFHQPAKAASIALVVREQDLHKANSIDQSASNLLLILGPIAGAELLVILGLAATLIVDSLSFLLSALLLTRLRIPDAKHERCARPLGRRSWR